MSVVESVAAIFIWRALATDLGENYITGAIYRGQIGHENLFNGRILAIMVNWTIEFRDTLIHNSTGDNLRY